ncbi:hypothetical protein KSP40_PGU022420 [Platanthera guangdongensis]|uniref:Uncharacterized protein n=1 Tax=Platanthera guangdongensis TaxID=2320717 RepID=A0ABR2LQ55_9ASPA
MQVFLVFTRELGLRFWFHWIMLESGICDRRIWIHGIWGRRHYISVVNPESTNRTEMPVPDNALYCGLLKDKQQEQSPHAQGLNSSSVLKSMSSILLGAMMLITALPAFL